MCIRDSKNTGAHRCAAAAPEPAGPAGHLLPPLGHLGEGLLQIQFPAGIAIGGQQGGPHHHMVFRAVHVDKGVLHQGLEDRDGAVSYTHLAQAGLDIIKAGGNAVDAAIATAACLTVVEPTANGIGSDCFALVWMKDENKLFGLNGSGPAPMGISAEALREQGLKEVPMYGWTPVNVPGTPSGWAELSKRFGKLPLSQVLEPAARYAEEGHAVAPTVSYAWKGALQKFTPIFGDQPCHKGWFDTFRCV